MSHFAKIENGIVTQVIVIDQETLNLGHWGDPASFVQTSYNTRGGVHYGQDGQPDGGVALHFNYAGVGFSWDGTGFAPPQPYPSWTKDTNTYLWNPPTPMPTDGKHYSWHEDTKTWVEVTGA